MDNKHMKRLNLSKTDHYSPILMANFKKLFVFLRLFIHFYREEKGRRKGRRETSLCSCLSHAPHWGPGPQPRHVP